MSADSISKICREARRGGAQLQLDFQEEVKGVMSSGGFEEGGAQTLTNLGMIWRLKLSERNATLPKIMRYLKMSSNVC